MSKVQQSGFEDIPTIWSSACSHPEHNPPTHLHIPQGKQYRHICPECGNCIIVVVPIVGYSPN